ncbi:hypothetical protein JCM9279_004217 [Rhodotorula babjevae]
MSLAVNVFNRPSNRSSSAGFPSAIEAATQQGMLRAGIVPGSSPLAHTEVLQHKAAHVEVFKRGRGADGLMRDQHLKADAEGVHDDVKDLFRTLDARIAQVERKHDHKTGGLTYSSQRTPSSTFSRALVPSSFLRSSASPAARAFGTSRVPAFDSGSDGEGDVHDEPCAFPHVQGLAQPRTADELAAVLAELKPGKKILKVAVNIDIEETFVTEVVVERSQPARKPVLVVMCRGGLPSTRNISASPRLAGMWRIGSRTPQKQVLILRCTKKVHVEIHFQLQLEVSQ